jgi:plastocyanin
LNRLLFFLLILACSSSLSDSINVTGRVELSHGRSRSPDLSGAVVWLTRTDDSSPFHGVQAGKRVQLVQKSKTFSPHLLVVPVGSSVEFPNLDPFFHNVFSLFEGKRFDLGLYESGSSRTVVFGREGISYIFCNIHPEMSAVVISLKTPYYGISDRKGLIVIPGVPTGTYEMQVWHERVLPESLEVMSRKVQIGPNFDSLGTLQMREQPDLGQKHKNKYGHDYDDPTPNSPVYSRQ